MKWLVCPNSFKHSLSAQVVCDIFEDILGQLRPQDSCQKIPLGDGGQGTKNFMRSIWPCEVEKVLATDHFGEPRTIDLLHFKEGSRSIIYLESADLIGLELYDHQDPWRASSGGLGHTIKHHIPSGSEVWVGLGGSATVDGGFGLLQTLGQRDLKGFALCDVKSPLWEASRFMQQKGVPSNQMAVFHNRLKRLAWTYPAFDPKFPGSGAAGGLGFALSALGLQLVAGLEFIWKHANLDSALAEADWVVTGEGRLDEQTWLGKGPGWVVENALHRNKKVLFLCGQRDGSPNQYIRGSNILSLDSLPPFGNAKSDLCHALRSFFQRQFNRKD